MNYFDLYSSYPDRTIAAAWDLHVKEADYLLRSADTLTENGGELFSRFAACYRELRALPRGVRRSLQRRLARSSELAAILPEYLQQGGRRLQHRMAWSLAGAALLLALGQGVGTAATITVTTNDPNIVADGQCSLIEAIINANNDAATHADCLAGSGADTIILPTNANVALGAVYCSMYGQFCRPVGLPPITSRITIEGNGAMIARQGSAPAFSLMVVRNSGDLALHSVTLSGGSSSSGGGAVSNNSGTLSIKNSTISGNTASSGGAVLNNGGNLTVTNSTISGNTANFSGGALYNYGDAVTIENSTISGNHANQGGGVYNSGGRLTVTNSTISGNSANSGGGLVNTYYCYFYGCSGGGTVTIENSTISGNTANFNGGGVINEDSSNLTITNSTISGNTADRGGGIFNSGNLTITNSTVSGNSANHGADVFNVLDIGATTLAAGEAGVAFTSDLMIFGGVPPYIVSIISGKLPAGLSLGNDGIISGTPSPTAKSATITVRITDSLNDSISKTFTITVLKALRIAGKPKTGRLGKDYSSSFKTRGGLGPFNWSITSGALPADLSFNTATGAITGIPAEAGTFPLTVQVTDALGGVAAESVTLKIK
jgi:hypothetical protein